MSHFFKSIGAFLLCVMMLLSSAAAESCFTIDVDTLDLDQLKCDDYVAMQLTSNAQGIQIRKLLSDSSEIAVTVRLALTRMDTQTLLLDKNYGYQSGTFDSGVIYLPCTGADTTPYLVTLYTGDSVYALPFMHTQPLPQDDGGQTDEWMDEGWSDDGWSDGWNDGWDDDWSSGW